MHSKIEGKLDALVKTDRMYNGHIHSIRFWDYDQDEDIYRIKAANRTFKFSSSEMAEEIDQFLPVVADTHPTEKNTDLTMMPDQQQFRDIKDTILENIKNVRRDKTYIKQADSICKSVNTLINMARLELQFVREQRRNT